MTSTARPPLTYPPFTVRIAGLPITVLPTLQTPRAVQCAARVLQAQRDLRRAAHSLDQALYDRIGEVTGQPEGRALLKLRRRAAEGGWTPVTLQQLVDLSPGLQPECSLYRTRLEACTAERRAGDVWFAEETRTAVSALHTWASSSPLPEALLLASGALLADARRCWAQERRSSKTLRQVQVSLTAYVLRAATKPSPFNRFASMASGVWKDDASLLACSPRWVQTVRSGLNLQVSGALLAAEGRVTDPNPALLVHLNNTLQTDEAAHTYLSVKGPVVRVKRSADLDDLIALLRSGPRTVRDVQDALPSPNLWKQLQRLQGVGLLDLLPSPGWRSEQLTRIDRLFGEFTRAGTAERPGQLLALQEATEAAYDRFHLSRLGWSPPERNLVFEDCGAMNLDPVASSTSWAPLLNDLRLVQRAFSVADGTLTERRAFARWFCRHYGAGASVPVVRVYQDAVQHHALANGPRRRFQWTVGTDDAYAEVVQQVRELLAGDPRGTVDTDALTVRLEQLPASWNSPSMAFYGQPVLGGDGPQFVLNAAQLGFGRTSGRARWILRQPPLRAEASRPVLDLTADLHANINQHACAHARSVVLPGGPVTSGQLGLRDLELSVGGPEERPTLLSRTLQQAVWAVPLGLLGEAHLPPLYRFLTAVTVGGPLDPALPELRPLPPAGAPQPRLQLGRAILQRARWHLSAAEAHALTQRDGFQALLSREAARQEWNLPMRAFVRVGQNGRWSKPAYVDFASPMTWAALPRMPSEGGEVLLEEALPDPLGAAGRTVLVPGREGQHVTELVLEPHHA